MFKYLLYCKDLKVQSVEEVEWKQRQNTLHPKASV